MGVLPENKLCRFGKWSGVVLFFSLSFQAAISQTTYQAESAVLSNGAKAADCPFCSGGRQVQNIGGPDNGTVTFDHVQVPRGGLYPMTVYFNVGDERQRSIRCGFSSHSRSEREQQPNGAGAIECRCQFHCV
jgi:hypothetical protein